MDTTPRRRWHRFSLRSALAVVTVFAAGAAWVAAWLQASREIVRQRRDVLYNYSHLPARQPSSTVPLGQRLLGDVPMERVVLGYFSTDDEIARVQRLFPEAKVERNTFDLYDVMGW